MIFAMSMMRAYRAGESLEDYCRACKTDRMHTIVVVDAGGQPLRVTCGYCRSEHNYRGGPRVGPSPPASRAPEGPPRPAPPADSPIRPAPALPRSAPPASDLEEMLRRVIREESGLTPVTPAEKWRGGQLVLKPGNPARQEKAWPIETFFHKVVMLRNRLRNLEQQINASDLPDDLKVKLQAYVSGCYGSLTSFNVLFADEEDQFQGTGGE